MQKEEHEPNDQTRKIQNENMTELEQEFGSIEIEKAVEPSVWEQFWFANTGKVLKKGTVFFDKYKRMRDHYV